MAHIAQALPTYAATFGLNYNAPRVPLPVFEPWNCIGKTYGGLATFSKYVPTEAVRLQLPSAFPWPTRIFQLDRCLGVHRFKTKWGKELVVINVHNSAYDKGGKLKAAEMTFLKDLLLREYAAGHYVICGGDWNQCPPNVKYDVFMPNKGENEDDGSPTLDMAFMPDGWVWAFDLRNPTNRSLVDPYQKGKTFVTLIDYFLLSPNIRLKTVQGIDNEFIFSDHQPVAMEVVLQ